MVSLIVVRLSGRLVHSDGPNRSEFQTAWHQSLSKAFAPFNALLIDWLHRHYADDDKSSLEVSRQIFTAGAGHDRKVLEIERFLMII